MQCICGISVLDLREDGEEEEEDEEREQQQHPGAPYPTHLQMLLKGSPRRVRQ